MPPSSPAKAPEAIPPPATAPIAPAAAEPNTLIVLVYAEDK